MHGMEPHDEIDYWRERTERAEPRLDRALSALRRLLAVVEASTGYSTHEEQAAIREARIIAGERP